MIGSSVEYQIDQRLYQLYENSQACNSSILIMVNALNVVIRQYPALGSVITTCSDLECFIAAVTEYEAEAEL